MKKLLFLVLLLPQWVLAQEVTVLAVLEQQATKHQLELCYSSDLVNLKEVVDCHCDSLSLGGCLKRLSYLSHLDISVDGQNLVVTHPGKQTIQMGGKVIDLLSNDELPFTHILQRDWGTGSISNAVGEFQVNVPKVLAGLKLEFSCLGYADTSVVIPAGDTSQLVIYLRPKPYNLNEVLVLPNGNTAEELVREAAKKIKRNYHRRKCQMEAFYRKTGMRDTCFMHLIEAALYIEDKGINMPVTSTKIKLEQIRKSRNYLTPENPMAAEAFKRWGELVCDGHQNLFYNCYQRNLIRSYAESFFYNQVLENDGFRFELEGAMWMDSAKVYEISYNYGKDEQGSKNKNIEIGGLIYINSADMSIVKLTHDVRCLEGNPLHKFSLPNGYYLQEEQSFQKINGKYYLKYIKGSISPEGELVIFNDKRNSQGEREIEAKQWGEELLVVTNVITERQQRERIRVKEQLDRHENSYETNYPYNAEFWSACGMLKQEPLPGRAVQDLEWEETLEVQFKENSTAHVNN